MKLSLFRSISFLFLLFIVAVTPMFGEDRFFNVSIRQNGAVVQNQDGIVILEKKPFELVIRFSGPRGIYVNASNDENLYQLVLAGSSISAILEQEGRWQGGAEFPHNPDNSFCLKDNYDSWQYWFFDGSKGNEDRFNIVHDAGDYIECIRQIDNFDIGGRLKPIRRYRFDSLYFVFADVTHDSSYSVFSEHLVQAIEVQFTD